MPFPIHEHNFNHHQQKSINTVKVYTSKALWVTWWISSFMDWPGVGRDYNSEVCPRISGIPQRNNFITRLDSKQQHAIILAQTNGDIIVTINVHIKSGVATLCLWVCTEYVKTFYFCKRYTKHLLKKTHKRCSAHQYNLFVNKVTLARWIF